MITKTGDVIAVQVFEIGGQRMIDGGDISELVVSGSWENVLDGKPGDGVAKVVLQKCDDNRLDVIHPYLHELCISLNGDVVFQGPIHFYSASIGAGAQIVAFDMTAWLAVRFVRDQFDWSTGEQVGVIIKYLITSAMRVADPNILPYLNVQPITHTIARQNGSLTSASNLFPGLAFPTVLLHTYAQGERPLTDPHEIVWSAYLSFLVGAFAHTSVFGRQINYWTYGTSLQNLPPADVSDFASFPNLTRNGDAFCTSKTVQVGKATFSNVTGTSGDYGLETPYGETPTTDSTFYVGQQLEVDSSLTMLIGTEYVANSYVIHPSPHWPVGFVFDNALLNDYVGSLSGDVFGEAGGVHPAWPVLVERFESQPDVIGRDQAQIIAQTGIVLTAPLATLDVAEFKAVVSSSAPWDFTKIAPGYTTLVTTRLGGIELQVSHVGGSWAAGKLELYVGLSNLSLPTTQKSYVGFAANTAPAEATVTPIVDTTDAYFTHRRYTGDPDDMTAPVYVVSSGRPAAFFFPPNTIVAIGTGPDVTAYQTAFPGYTTLNINNSDYDLLALACKTGVGF